MTIDPPTAPPDLPGDGPAPSPAERERASRVWRSMWRTHFYAGIFVMPTLVMLALTGLVILYTDTINQVQFGDLYRAASTEQAVSLDEQRAAVVAEYPDASVMSVTPPRRPGDTTRFSVGLDEGERSVDVFVDPSNGEVLGASTGDAGLVGLANRLHGMWNNESMTVPLPTFEGLFGGGEEVFTDVAIGDVAIEIAAVWALVLVITGLYLWWPRKEGTGRRLFAIRFAKRGRARWRDLHAVPGVVLSVMLAFFVITGLPWSGFWGTNWSFVATKLTPNAEGSYSWMAEAPVSAVPELGALDRVGNRVPWAARENVIPPSTGGGHGHGDDHDHGGADDSGAGVSADAPVPAPVSLDLVAQAAREEGMLAGFTIAMPADVPTEDGSIVYGSYAVTNPWPSNVASQGALFVNQFDGTTISRSTSDGWGALQTATELGVQTHMGTQFGLVNRIVLTVACVLVLWSAFSGLVMWWKRRRHGLGFPRRPVDASLGRAMIIVAVVLALLYPLWGASVLVILLLDRFVIRSWGPLRRTFGMHERAAG